MTVSLRIFCGWGKLQSCRVTELQSYRVTELQSFRVGEFQSSQSYNTGHPHIDKASITPSQKSLRTTSLKLANILGLTPDLG